MALSIGPSINTICFLFVILSLILQSQPTAAQTPPLPACPAYDVAPPKAAPALAANTSDGSVFWFFKYQAPWCTAELHCRSLGGHLASVLNSKDDSIVQEGCFEQLGKADPLAGCWIGLNDQQLEGNYTWTDGSPFRYVNWYKATADFAQPDDDAQPDQEDCVFVYKAYPGWHDRDCNASYYYVCKVPPNATTTQAGEPQPQPAPVLPLPPSPPAAPAAPPAPPALDTGKLVVSVVVPVLTGLAAMITILYTLWKWWHKRAEKLAARRGLPAWSKKQAAVANSLAGGSTAAPAPAAVYSSAVLPVSLLEMGVGVGKTTHLPVQPPAAVQHHSRQG